MIVNKLKLNGPGFPESLSHIPLPPKEIYWAGINPHEWISRPKLAVVGSRKFTIYGKTVTERLVSELASAGAVIISGLAYGIDITAHRAALASGGTTVAVLPSGLDNIYPASHANIAAQISISGTLITEYPNGSAIAYKSNFIARNRLISGLADAILITEAAINSGSLHTARFALEQGKTVMAVPGNITGAASAGCNNLIKSGAVPVTEAGDIFFNLKLPPVPSAKKIFSGTEEEEKIYSLIRDGIAAQEELALAAQIDGASVSSALTMLEISGYIRPSGGGRWIAA